MERHVRSYGFFFYFFGTLFLLCGLYSAITSAMVFKGEQSAFGVVYLIFNIFLIGLGIIHLIVGRALRTFRPWGRILGIICACPLLIGFPIGTAVGIYGLWALCSAEGKALFQSQP